MSMGGGGGYQENPMTANCATVVQVRDAWRGWRTAEVQVEDLQRIHWFQPPGAPRSIVHAYVKCTNLRGDIPHHCTSGGQHRVRVCILKRCVAPSVHAELARRADAGGQPDVPEPAAKHLCGGLLARTQQEGAAHSVPWLWLAAGGGLLLAAILGQRRRSQIGAALVGAVRWSAAKRQPGAVAA